MTILSSMTKHPVTPLRIRVGVGEGEGVGEGSLGVAEGVRSIVSDLTIGSDE